VFGLVHTACIGREVSKLLRDMTGIRLPDSIKRSFVARESLRRLTLSPIAKLVKCDD
jgi:hypothetical protein